MVRLSKTGESNYKLEFPRFDRVSIEKTDVVHSSASGYNNLTNCPKLFITAHLDSSGRTHNQLQDFASILLLSAKVKRTFVLSPLYVRRGSRHLKFDTSLFLDVEELGKEFCVVSHDYFLKYLEEQGKTSTDLVFYSFDDWPSGFSPFNSQSFLESDFHKKSPGNNTVRTTFSVKHETIPRGVHFSCTSGYHFAEKPLFETLMLVHCDVAFRCRHSMEDLARVYRVIKPSSYVGEEVKRQTTTMGQPFVAMHIRHRENTCNKEARRFLAETVINRSNAQFHLSGATIQEIVNDCINDASFLLRRYQSSVAMLSSEKLMPLFIATDNQKSLSTFRSLLTRNYASAVIYSYKANETRRAEERRTVETSSNGYGDLDNLYDLFVDYFVLTEATFFWGNTLSSFSNNALFKRLGDGKESNGVLLGYMRYAFQ
ncbi:GDP-fucose protein O-fucosyltransferase, putative [Angomonas deanei]|uniref:GDP-fucose protein O-fucosyltransferase, putative n=1 Tax=Angomonas deanei TaxID=59799 RepID=A0A7G2C3U3_9TRYP|nr:GDP-fucose protein O-fucosyltransferase, putative [Angomonas deanei]